MRIKNLPSILSMDGSQDALVIEQTDGSEDKSRKVSPAQIKQYVLGNSIDDIYSVMGQNGAKNLLVPKWVETQTTENGVTYTFNANGTITMNTDASGATADTNCNLRNKDVTTNNLFPAGSYIFTGCPEGGSATTYRMWLRAYRPNTATALTTNLYEAGNGVSFTVSEPFTLGINLTVRKNYVCNNLTWKPMLRLASDTDNTYQPYAKTNRQLTEVIGDLSQTGLTGDSVAEQFADVIADRALIAVAKDSVSGGTTKDFDIGSENGVFLVVVGQGGSWDLVGLYLIKITQYSSGTNVKPIVTPATNVPTITATEISSQNGKITATSNGAGFIIGIYKFNLPM